MSDITFDHIELKPDLVDYVIYHGNCIDGFTSAFCAYDYLSNKYPNRNVTYYSASFDKLPPLDEIKNKNILMCDFSYKYANLMKIINVCNKFCILDHHLSALNELKDVPDKYKVFRMDHCGSYLTYRYFNQDKSNQEVPMMIKYVEDNDIWLKKEYKTHEFTSYVYTMPFTFE